MNNKYAKLSIYTLSLLVSVALVPSVSAEEINVTDNGAHSENNVSVSNSSTTSTQASNQMNVSNNVETKSDTGGNNTSGNTGDQNAIITGDAKTASEVTTSGNITTVNAGCCESTSSSTTVTSNGAGSENSVNRTNTSTTSVSVVNNAKIVNNISIKANTGNNRASYNTGGDTIIKTGDIKAVSNVTNGPVNITKVKTIEDGKNAISSYLKIAGNGAFSENLVNEVNHKNVVVNTDNFADFINNIDALLNTGNNVADYNSGGETLIVTGDIDFKAVIDNIANFNIVKVVCGCDKEKEKPNKPHEEKPGQPSAPTPPTTSVGGPGGPGGPAAPGPGAPAPTTLPVTGNNMLFFLLLANVLMFFLGMYLRLRSGRSPGYSVAL